MTETYSRQPTVVFDLDGVIATGTIEEIYSDEAGWAYEKCHRIQSTYLVMKHLHSSGVKIIINTARWESDREATMKWLQKNSIPYDELHLGKPYGHVYVDDRNYPNPYTPGIFNPEVEAARISEAAKAVALLGKSQCDK